VGISKIMLVFGNAKSLERTPVVVPQVKVELVTLERLVG